jgi:hypothetical protein
MDKKNLNRVSSILPLYTLAFLFLIFSLACSVTGSAATAPPATGEAAAATVAIPTEPAPAPTPVLTGPVEIGQPFLMCDTAVTVIGWESYVSKETDLFTPKAGNRFVAVEIVMVNLGTVPVETIWYNFDLLDAYDEELPDGVFPMMYVHSASLMGGLGPGERTRAKKGYEVPKEEQEFSLQAKCYNFDNDQKGEVTVELGSQPRSVEAPGKFEGEISRDPLAVGKSAMVNSIEIAPKEVLAFPESLIDPDDPRVATPPDWMKYVVVDMDLVNKGRADYELFVTTDLYVQDLEGRRWFAATWVSFVMEDPIKESITLKPGDKVSGQLAFQVPKEGSHQYLVFENGYGSAGQKAYFLLS